MVCINCEIVTVTSTVTLKSGEGGRKSVNVTEKIIALPSL